MRFYGFKAIKQLQGRTQTAAVEMKTRVGDFNEIVCRVQ